MSVADAVDVAIEIFGGLVTQDAPADLPHGVSPDCQDVQFQQGNVQTRPGLTSLYALPGNPTVQYLKTYENLQLTPRLLSLDSLGVLRKDQNPGGPLTIISSQLLPGAFAKSSTAFGREYIAISDGKKGFDIPRQYDDTNLDRISQVGPGLAPNAIDENIQQNILASPNGAFAFTAPIAAGPAGLTQVGFVVTVTLTISATGLQFAAIGDPVQITGAGVGGYNGTFTISAILQQAGGFTTFQYVNTVSGLAASGGGTVNFATGSIVVGGITGPFLTNTQSATIAGVAAGVFNGTFTVRSQGLGGGNTTYYIFFGAAIFGQAASGNGTITAVGNIPAGKHQVSVIFVTRNGYFTKPAPPTSWVAGGGKRVVVANIPVGPPNVIARILCFTAVNGASFYHLGPTGLTIPTSNMYIADNVTTSLAVDFTDAILLLGTLDDPLFRLIELPEVAGTIDYAERLFAWGELNLVQGFIDLSMDGGFSNPGSAPNFPLGWTPDATSSAGGGSAVANGFPPFFGDAYQITGDGATAVRGLIAQSAAVDYLGNPILQPNTAYTVRARIAVNAAANAGTIHVNLKSVTLGFTTVGIALAFNQLTQGYAVYTGNLTAPLATIPSDLVLEVYVDGTANAAAIFSIKNIGIIPTAVPTNPSNLRGSGTGNANNQTPESFDVITGLIQFSENNGQALRTCFKIRERLYAVKEHSFFATQDDGVNEPAKWAIQEISSKIGTPSINGVGGSYRETGGEDWVVIAHRTGLYLFWGGEPMKISQEIQPTWDTINWQFGHLISVAVDTKKRRILVSAPFGTSTIPNKTLVLDYHDVGGPEMLASQEPIRLSFQGRKIVSDKARKWCPWTIPANAVQQVEQANGTSQVYFGSNDGTGNINLLDDNNLTDNGATIPSYYTTAFFPEMSAEQALQLRSHRKLFTYLTVFAQGSGLLSVTAYPDSLSNGQALNPFTLTNPSFKDLEMMINISIERCAFKFSSSGNGQWFSLQRACTSMKQEPWSQVRGA